MVSYINVSISTRWHLDTQKSGGPPDKMEHTSKRAEAEFSTNSVSLIKLY